MAHGFAPDTERTLDFALRQHPAVPARNVSLR
jgi:hypothetical protein